MSGIEVVGLVLGVLPLVVSALEHYQDACRLKGLLTQFKSEYGKALEDVKDEQVNFHLSLELLLLPLAKEDILDGDEVETLLADPHSPGWNVDDVAEALEGRLGRTYPRFMEIINAVHLQVSKLLTTLVHDKPRLQARLKADHSNPPSASDQPKCRLSASALERFFKEQVQYKKEQMRFGIGKKEREDLLKEIHKNNKKLEKLLEKSDRIASYKTSKITAVPPKAVKSLLQYWQHADRVYTLMHQSWGCKCKDKHCALLWLQHRTTATFEFKLLVLWAPKSLQGEGLPPWDRQGLQITSLKSDSLQSQHRNSLVGMPVLKNIPSTLKETPPTSSAIGVPAKDGKRRRVGFAGIQLCAGSGPASPSPTGLAPSESQGAHEVVQQTSIDTALLSEINKLCAAMTSCGMQACCIGSLTDNEGRRYSVFSQPEQKIASGEITLDGLLHSSYKQRLKRSDRFRIALAIASSHLQLHSTSWARKQWEAADIRFPKNVGQQGAVMFDKPYVSADFNATLPSRDLAPNKFDRSFACLGIMLLELLFGFRLEDHELWQQPGFAEYKALALFRLMVARQWADSVEDEAGPDFSAAVMWCLNESPTTLEDDHWRRDLADRVVLPLENCCNWIKARPLS